MALRLPVRQPFAAEELLAFIGERAIPGVESWDGDEYRRSLRLVGGRAVIAVRAARDHVAVRLRLSAWSDLAAAVQRIRRLLDLDADPAAVDEALAATALAPVVTATPGRRAPASVDPFETAVRAIIGQQVSVAGARTVAGRIVDAVGPSVTVDEHDPAQIARAFPGPDELAGAPDDAFSMPRSRRDTIRRFARLVADGDVVLHPGVEPAEARAQLLGVKGIGPWTADYVVMRGLGHPDTFLAGDLGVRHGLDRLGLDAGSAETFAPWRSYAVHHLWATLAAPEPSPNEPLRGAS